MESEHPGRAGSILGLVREERRATLRTRTITVSLVSALNDYARSAGRDAAADDERILLRRAWCERALQMLQDVRVANLRAREVARRVTAAIHDEGGIVDLSELEAACRDADVSMTRGEETARRWLDLAG